MGRDKLPERQQVLIRVPKARYLEMILWNPQLQGDRSFLRYGAVNQHINALIQRDIDSKKEAARGRTETAPVSGI